MKKRIIYIFIFVVLFIVWYFSYSFITDKYKCNNWISCTFCNAINEIWIEKECIMQYPEWGDEIGKRYSCLSYSLDHPYVRCPSEHENGQIRYCHEIYCARGEISENCFTKYECKD